LEMILLGLKVVVPLFIAMAVGYLARRVNLIDEAGVSAVNRLVYWVFLPAILFVSIYETDLTEVFNFRLVLYSVIGTTLLFVVSFLMVPLFEKKRERCGVIIQGLIRGNEVYFGFPVVISLIGERYLGLMAIIVAFAVPMYNAFSIIALESFKRAAAEKNGLLKSIITNPLIIVTAIGVTLVLAELEIPVVIMDGIVSLSKVATPLALFLLGASFSFTKTKGYLKEVVWVTFIRLIVLPAIVIGTTMLLGFEWYETVILYVTFGVPTAVASFSLARQLGADSVLASQIVVYTSSFAILSVFLWTLVMQLLEIL